MEFKVWVEGIQRIVCGVTINTTCQDIVYALAHATGKVGRFTLIERWRNNERLLAPNEYPLKILTKWGEYSNDVQFILKKSEDKNDSKSGYQLFPREKLNIKHFNMPVKNNSDQISTINAETKTEVKPPENVGIVKGIPQQISSMSLQKNKSSSETSYISYTEGNYKFKRKDLSAAINSIEHNSTNSAQENYDFNVENILEMLSYNKQKSNSNSEITKYSSLISSNGALVPPPYRDPPPPRTSPFNKIDNFLIKTSEYKENTFQCLGINVFPDINDKILQSAPYKDLINIINEQQEKISSQKSDLTRYDAEIVYLENKERDQIQKIDAITREINKADQIFRQGSEQLQTLQYVEEENELVRQQEKTLKSEITLLRSKLANCETELLQCKNKIRLLLDDIQIEQRSLINRQNNDRQQMERNILLEVERIQAEIDQAIQNTETTTQTTENLKNDIALIENAIADKKKQVEQLVNEMKEVNLQSLTVTPSEEIKHLLEGSSRLGSTRRIIGSPRQLENAVPTNRNPHGVWV